MKPLLVGEQPPPRASLRTHSPLYPVPDGCSGDRLCRMLQVTRYAYLMKFDRVNLVPHPGPSKEWPSIAAAWSALSMIRGGLVRDRCVVLVGDRVRRAFAAALGCGNNPRSPFDWFDVVAWRNDAKLVAIPHPSGRSRAWNDPEVRVKMTNLAADLRREAGITTVTPSSWGG